MATTNEASNGEPLLAAPDTPRSEAPHHEHHYSQRSPWVRAAVLGACDGVVTVGALITGIASAQGNQKQLLLSACAGMMSGALSMAVGEFVSVSQQADMEKADVAAERQAQNAGPESRAEEFEELVQIHIDRGLPEDLARKVAQVYTDIDPVRAHARDELGIDIDNLPDARQAAVVSFVYFISGALLPTLALLLPDRFKFWGVVTAVTVALAAFGAIASSVGGTSMLLGSTRLVVGGWIAMLCTAAVGYLFMEDSPGEAKLLGGI